jgi:2-iminobutanoate/2-iminopropanoate deaminase
MKKLLRVALTGLALMAAVGIASAQDAKKVISTPDAPDAIGPYSQAIRVGKLVFLSGQIAIDPKTKELMANARSMCRRVSCSRI